MTNTPRTKLTLRVRPPQPDGEKATPTVLRPVSREPSEAADGAGSSSAPPGSPAAAQRGRKRAASCDAADPAPRKGLAAVGAAPGAAWKGSGGGGDGGSGSAGGGSAGGGEGGGSSAATSMDIETSSGSSPARKPPEVGSSSGGSNGHSSSPSRKAAAAAEQAVPAQGVPGRLPGFSSGNGDASSPVEEISSAGVVAGNGGGSVVVEGCMKDTPPSELPLLELEKQSTVDTLFELMESGQSVSVLVWDLLMKMPTNMRLFNGFL